MDRAKTPFQPDVVCAFCAFSWLDLTAHRGAHGGDDGVSDSALEELVELPG
jgi:hypothetical protein